MRPLRSSCPYPLLPCASTAHPVRQSLGSLAPARSLSTPGRSCSVPSSNRSEPTARRALPQLQADLTTVLDVNAQLERALLGAEADYRQLARDKALAQSLALPRQGF